MDITKVAVGVIFILAVLAIVGYLLLVQPEQTEEVSKPEEKKEEVSKPEEKKEEVPRQVEQVEKIISESTEQPGPVPVSTAQEPQYSVFLNTDYAGHDIQGGVSDSLESCKKSCDDTENCNAFVIGQVEEKNYCFLKDLPVTAIPRYDTNWSTYYKGTPPTAGQAKENEIIIEQVYTTPPVQQS